MCRGSCLMHTFQPLRDSPPQSQQFSIENNVDLAESNLRPHRSIKQYVDVTMFCFLEWFILITLLTQYSQIQTRIMEIWTHSEIKLFLSLVSSSCATAQKRKSYTLRVPCKQGEKVKFSSLFLQMYNNDKKKATVSL